MSNFVFGVFVGVAATLTLLALLAWGLLPRESEDDDDAEPVGI